MKELKFIKLENDKEYYVITEITLNDNKYYVLVNQDNNYDIVIRKDEKEYLVGLDDADELKSVLSKLIIDNKDNPDIIKLIDGLNNK